VIQNYERHHENDEMNKNKIKVYHGTGSFVDSSTIKIDNSSGGVTNITFNNAVIATGSKPTNLPFAKIDKKRVITSTEALKLPEVPKHLLIIGGGIIGLEMGSVYLRLGSQVTVVEYANRLTPGMDGDISKDLKRIFAKQGMKFDLLTLVLNSNFIPCCAKILFKSLLMSPSIPGVNRLAYSTTVT
jgi:dihydrolipoamide dehydrogenase